jgi:hypothetical protein
VRRSRATGGSGEQTVDLLGFRALVVGPLDLVRAVRALRPDPPPGTAADGAGPDVVFRLRRAAGAGGAVEVLRDGRSLRPPTARDAALAFLIWAINSAATERLRATHLLFHAGAVSSAGHGLLLPAPAGYGKTTLVAALIAAGFGYFGDDIAAVDPATLALLPFAKSLAVKAGGRRVLAPFYPALGPGRAGGVPRLRAGGETVWYLPPPADAWPGRPAPVRYVVLPRYVSRSRTALTPVTRSEALERLLEQSFGIAGPGGRGLPGVASAVELVRRAECYALTVGRLGTAVRVLADLTGARAPRR